VAENKYVVQGSTINPTSGFFGAERRLTVASKASTIATILPSLPATFEGHWGIEQYVIPHTLCETLKPKIILEIGFNAGWSAFMWLLAAPDAVLVAVDIGEHPSVAKSGKIMKDIFGSRFHLVVGSSHDTKVQRQAVELCGATPDIVFVDGDHSVVGAVQDLEWCVTMKTPTIILDDVTLSPDVHTAKMSFLQAHKDYRVTDHFALGWGVDVIRYT
jgi:predicted O-methyltransferase YrrM